MQSSDKMFLPSQSSTFLFAKYISIGCFVGLFLFCPFFLLFLLSLHTLHRSHDIVKFIKTKRIEPRKAICMYWKRFFFLLILSTFLFAKYISIGFVSSFILAPFFLLSPLQSLHFKGDKVFSNLSRSSFYCHQILHAFWQMPFLWISEVNIDVRIHKNEY